MSGFDRGESLNRSSGGLTSTPYLFFNIAQLLCENSFPLSFSRLSVVLCAPPLTRRGVVWGEGSSQAPTTNSAHERLKQQEQLSSIVCLCISSVPHLASECVRAVETTEERGR